MEDVFGRDGDGTGVEILKECEEDVGTEERVVDLNDGREGFFEISIEHTIEDFASCG